MKPEEIWAFGRNRYRARRRCDSTQPAWLRATMACGFIFDIHLCGIVHRLDELNGAEGIFVLKSNNEIDAAQA